MNLPTQFNVNDSSGNWIGTMELDPGSMTWRYLDGSGVEVCRGSYGTYTNNETGDLAEIINFMTEGGNMWMLVGQPSGKWLSPSYDPNPIPTPTVGPLEFEPLW